MTTISAPAPEGLYVTGPRWHLVHGPEVFAPETGSAYLFRCFRWMRVSEAAELGIFRGVPRDSDPVCGFCREYGAQALDADVPEPDETAEEP
jgi:hypothetical protein